MDPAAPGTQKRFASSLRWAFVMNSGVRSVGLLSTFVLAGILGPRDFGLVSMAMVYITLIQVFLDGGVATALIQREKLEREHLDSAFWMTVVWCLALSGLSIALSGWWADLNGEPELGLIVPVLTSWLLIMGLTVVQQAVLRREMRFKALAFRANLAALAGAGLGIGLAVTGFGVWALVAMELVEGFVNLVVLWAVSDWRPGLRFSKRHARDLLGFSLHAFAGDLGGFITRRADFLLIGVFLGPTVVGLYRLADRLVEGVLNVSTTPIGVVSLPHFSRLQSDARSLRRAVRESVRAMALATVPALLVLAACAGYLTAALGPQWLPATDALKLLAVIGIGKAMLTLVNPLLFALARLRLRTLVIWSLAAASVVAFSIAGVVLQGLPVSTQVLWAAGSRGFLFALVFVPVTVAVLCRFTGLRVSSLLQPFGVPVVAGAAAVGVVAGLEQLGAFEHLPAVAALVASGAVAVVSAGAVLWALEPRVRYHAARMWRNVSRRHTAVESSL